MSIASLLGREGWVENKSNEREKAIVITRFSSIEVGERRVRRTDQHVTTLGHLAQRDAAASSLRSFARRHLGLIQLRLELCAVVTKKRRLGCDLSVSSDRNAQAIRAAHPQADELPRRECAASPTLERRLRNRGCHVTEMTRGY
jgi:hypothetical protein